MVKLKRGRTEYGETFPNLRCIPVLRFFEERRRIMAKSLNGIHAGSKESRVGNRSYINSSIGVFAIKTALKMPKLESPRVAVLANFPKFRRKLDLSEVTERASWKF